jgi:hypothetical protein
MPKSQDVVLSYQKALQQADFSSARNLLHDNLEFRVLSTRSRRRMTTSMPYRNCPRSSTTWIF